MKEAGFNVRKWKSSSKRLMEWIDEKDGVPIKEMVKLSWVDVNINCACYLKFQGTSLSCLNNWLSSHKITNLTTQQSAFHTLILNGLLPYTIIHLEHVSVPPQNNWLTQSEAGSHLQLDKKNWYDKLKFSVKKLFLFSAYTSMLITKIRGKFTRLTKI